MITISFDPGLSGAFAVFTADGLHGVYDLPVMHIPDVGPGALIQNKIDGAALLQLMRANVPPGHRQAVVEAVGVMGGQNNAIQAQGSLMRTLGAIESILECMQIPIAYAHIGTWKDFYGLKGATWKEAERKEKSLAKARVLYPQCGDLERARDHNRAEAILIGHWYRRKFVRRDARELEAAF